MKCFEHDAQEKFMHFLILCIYIIRNTYVLVKTCFVNVKLAVYLI